MMHAEHRRPFAALLLVFAAACMIMGNGLRTQVVEVLVGAGAPRPLIAAIAPDMVLGQSLINAPQAPQARPPVPREVPVAPDDSDDSDDSDSESDAATTPVVVGRADRRPTDNPRSGRAETRPNPAAGPAAPDEAATPGPAPAPEPEPTSVPGPRPGFAPPITTLQPGDRSPAPAVDDRLARGHGWGHDEDNVRHEDRGERRRSHDRDDRGDHRPEVWSTGSDRDRGRDRDRGEDRGDRGRGSEDRGDRGRGSEDRRGRGTSSGDSRHGSVSDRDSRSRGHSGHGR